MRILNPVRFSSCCTLLFLLHVLPIESQQIEVSIPSTIALPPSHVSSECTLSRTGQDDSLLLAIVLTAKPSSQRPNYHTQVWQSLDDGQSWSHHNYPHLPQAADPWGVIWANGALLVADISEGNRFHLHTSHFDPQSKQWAAPISFGFGFDHCMLLKGLAPKSVYLIATQKYQDEQAHFQSRLLIGYSKDSGRTFHEVHYHELIQGLEFNAKQAFIHPNGTLLIPITLRGFFFEKQETSIPFEQMQTWLCPFSDHGANSGTPTFITTLSGRKHHWLIPNRQNPEHLFFAFTDVEQQRLGLIQSHNRGASWTAPTWIYQDTSSERTVDLSAMAINYQEDLAIAWAKKIGENCYQRMLTVLSPDKEHIIHQEIGARTCPDDSNGWVARAWPQGGDYCGLSISSDNRFHLLYSSPKNGRFEPHFTQISIIK